MPPRYSYWTIIAGGLPTAFRAAEKDELLPTYARIKQKHPDAEMKWFARGKLWESPESARAATRRPEQPPSGVSSPSRGREWRPGGEHRDPRQKYRDAKTARNVDRRKQKFERKRQFEQSGPVAQQPSRKPLGPRLGPRRQGKDERPRQMSPRMDRPDREPTRRDGQKPTSPPRSREPLASPPKPHERRGRRGPDQNRRRSR